MMPQTNENASDVFLTKPCYRRRSSLVHAIMGLRASPFSSRRAGWFPGSHGPENCVLEENLQGRVNPSDIRLLRAEWIWQHVRYKRCA